MIASNVLKIKDKLNTAKDKFGSIKSSIENAKESTLKSVANSSAVSSVQDGTASVLEKFTNKDSNSGGLTGLFADAICGKSPSRLNSLQNFSNLPSGIKTEKYKSLLNLGKSNKLGFDLSFNATICGKTKSINPIDAVTKVANYIRKNPSVLKSPKETLLRSLAKGEIIEKLGLGSLGKVIQSCLIDKIIGDMNSNDYGAGPTLRSKNTLKNLLNQDQCMASIANLPLVSKWLSNSSTMALINTLLNKDKNTTQDLIEALLLVTGQRDSALGGLASAIASATDYNTRAKLQMVNKIFKNPKNKITSKDYISVKTDSSTVLKQLDKEKENSNPQTNNPSQDFTEIKETLDILDKSWNQDDNYYKVTGNKSLKDLACRTLMSKTNEINLTGVYTTKLEPEHHITIINTFHCDDCDDEINLHKVSSACSVCGPVTTPTVTVGKCTTC